MGFWDWFRSKPPRVAERDLIWMTRTGKLAGLAAEVKAIGRPVPVLAHFPHTLRDTEDVLAAVGFRGERIDGPISPADLLARLTGGSARPLLALVSQLRPAEPVEAVETDPVQFLLAERHFLRDHDDVVSAFADGLGHPASATFFLSLEDPLMKAFAGEWVADVLRRLGMKEGEAIESQMVLRRLRAAQGMYAKAARGDEPADSPDEWLERNVPPG